MTQFRGRLCSIIDDTRSSVDNAKETIRVSEDTKSYIDSLPGKNADTIKPLFLPRDFCEESYKKRLTDSHQTVKKTSVWRSVATLLIAPWVWWSRLNG